MFNDPGLFWKNFRLGTELQVSGSFLYNALYYFDKMETFYFEEESFEFLYNASVGIERLEKITIILLEHNDMLNQNDFEKSLITHSHLELLDRIKKIKPLTLGKCHTKFLQLLQTFYNSSRYDRFNLMSAFRSDQDRNLLTAYLSEELEIEINAYKFEPSQNDERIKKFIGKVIVKIATELYKIIQNRAFELKIFTYELSYDSKAFKIFIGQGPDFENEKLLKKEILVFLLNKNSSDRYIKFITEIEPLKLESYNTSEYIAYLLEAHNKGHMIGELQTIYEDTKFDKDRFKAIKSLGQRFNDY